MSQHATQTPLRRKRSNLLSQTVTIVAVRNVQIDSYLSKQFRPGVGDAQRSPLSGKPLFQVPVIRIYGPSVLIEVSTSANKNLLVPRDTDREPDSAGSVASSAVDNLARRGPESLVHVHGVFPYFYCELPPIPVGRMPQQLCTRCDGDAHIDNAGENWKKYTKGVDESHTRTLRTKSTAICCQLCKELLSILETKLTRDEKFAAVNREIVKDGSPFALLYDVQLVARKSIYGFQREPQLFLKISCTRPQDCALVGSLVFSGTAFDRAIQPFELHIPYLVQFMADWEISGPDWFFFLKCLVPSRKSMNEKMSHLESLCEWDLTPVLLLSQMALNDPSIRHERRQLGTLAESVTDSDLLEMSQNVEDGDTRSKETTWKESFTRRFGWDFNDKFALSPTDSLNNLWTSELERRQKYKLLKSYPLGSHQSYLCTEFDEEKRRIPIASTLPRPAGDEKESLMTLLKPCLVLPQVEVNKYKRKREENEINQPPASSKKAKHAHSAEQDDSEGVPTAEHVCPAFSGYVQMPYWSRASDLESDRIRHSLPAYHFQAFNPVRQVPPVDRCNFCDLNCAGLVGKRTSQFVSASFATRNAHGVFHQCAFFAEDLADRFLGRRLPLSKKTLCASFVFAKRPPPVSVIISEAQDYDAQAETASPARVNAPALDSHGRLVFLNVQSLTQVQTQLSQDSDDLGSQILTPEKGGSPSLIDVLTQGSASASGVSSVRRRRQMIDRLEAVAGALFFKARAVMTSHVAPEIRGALGRVLYMELILNMQIDSDFDHAPASGSDALRSLARVYRRRGLPEVDGIAAAVVAWKNLSSIKSEQVEAFRTAVIYVGEAAESKADLVGMATCCVECCPDEKALILRLMDVVDEVDPALIAAWDVKHSSFGYLLSRAAVILQNPNILPFVSRLRPKQNTQSSSTPTRSSQTLRPSAQIKPIDSNRSALQTLTSKVIRIDGRLLYNGWRLMKNDIRVSNFSFHNVAKTVAQLTLPEVDALTLHQWWTYKSADGRFPLRHQCVNYAIQMITSFEAVVDKVDSFGKSATMAQVFGLEWFASFSRGSQFFVEALLCRAARRLGFLLLTASKKQVYNQDGLEAIPMVLEPKSLFYYSPVIVVDYQSLYPSLIIGYNLCYSTCLGKAHKLRQAFADLLNERKIKCQMCAASPSQICARCITTEKVNIKMGVHNLSLSFEDVLSLSTLNPNLSREGKHVEQNQVFNVMPNGAVFLSEKVRRGVLPALLEQILQTRVMLKASQKVYSKISTSIQQVLNHQQFSLKFVANVTYGYTGASFSGRMPCGEVADAIVSMARHCLQSSIEAIERTQYCRPVEVVYGDTDSIFIHVPNGSMEEAFAIGEKIVADATRRNVKPMELKLEKVYQTCCLQTKKRYTGQAFESLEAYYKSVGLKSAPDLRVLKSAESIALLERLMHSAGDRHGGMFDSKGIETIRRDQCVLVQKTTSRFIQSVFASSDLSLLRSVFVSTMMEMANIVSQDPSTNQPLPLLPIEQNPLPIQVRKTARHLQLLDFIFSKDIKLGLYAWNRGGPAHTLPPQAAVALWMTEVQGSAAAQSNEGATRSNSEVGETAAEGEEEDVATIFDINEQVSYLVAQGHSGMRINDRGVAPYRVLRHLPRCLGHPAMTRALSMIWDRAVGQYPMSVHLDYYKNNQVAQVIKRFSVLLPGSTFDMFTGLPIDKWISAIPKSETMARTLRAKWGVCVEAACHSMSRGVEIDRGKVTEMSDDRSGGCIDVDVDIDDIDLRDLAEDRIEDAGGRNRSRPYLVRAPIAAMTGTKVLEQFFTDKPKNGNEKKDTESGRPCRVCKQRIRNTERIGKNRRQVQHKQSLIFNKKWLRSNTVSLKKQSKFFPNFDPEVTDTPDATLCSTCQTLSSVSALEGLRVSQKIEDGVLLARRICMDCTGGGHLQVDNCREAYHCPVYQKRLYHNHTFFGEP